jgi:uncharacterized protein
VRRIGSVFEQGTKNAPVRGKVFKLHIDQGLKAFFQPPHFCGYRLFDSRLHLHAGPLIKSEYDRVFRRVVVIRGSGGDFSCNRYIAHRRFFKSFGAEHFKRGIQYLALGQFGLIGWGCWQFFEHVQIVPIQFAAVKEYYERVQNATRKDWCEANYGGTIQRMQKHLKIVLPGGTGQLGTILARHFQSEGHEVVTIGRASSGSASWKTVVWDGTNLDRWAEEFQNADVVINLAGRSVNCRYTPANRREIKESRTCTTRLVGEAIRQAKHSSPIWMNTSTATIYRHAFDRPMDEARGELGGNEPNAPSTWKFSIDVATSWEEAFFAAPAGNIRKIALRSAMVMSPDRGGVFDTLLSLVRAGLGGTSGSGKQFVSWIHDWDFVRSIDYLIAHEDIDGTVNLASPSPIPNREFMAALRTAWGTRIGLPAAEWMLEIGAVFLRTETELILKSRRVVPGRLLAHGFRFDFPEWPVAAQNLVECWRQKNRTSTRPSTPYLR